MHKVFVYGTLKRGFGNNRLLRDAKFLGRAFLLTHHAFKDLGSFPGLIRIKRNAPRLVGGEVWEVTDEQRDSLDMLEGHPNFYERQPALVHTTNGMFTEVETYTLPDTAHYRALPEVPETFWRPSADERQELEEYTEAMGV